MQFAPLSPTWFLGYDVLFEIFFAVITFLISWLAFRVYRLTASNRTKLFAAAFLFISLSYTIELVYNFMIVTALNQNIHYSITFLTINVLHTLGIFSQAILMVIGLSILTYACLRVNKRRVLALILALTLSVILLEEDPLFYYFIFSTIFLAFISAYFFENYLSHKQLKTGLLSLGFVFLLLAKFYYIFSESNLLFYALGHFLELIAYTFITANLVLVLKK